MELLPDMCPLCHYALVPKVITAVPVQRIIGKHRDTHLEVVFKCPRFECAHLFIGRYWRISESSSFIFGHVVPSTPKPPDIPSEIDQLSPNFSEIYKQAAASENANLNQIAGVGYRKALEFLIKDYCIAKNPTKEDDIKKRFLVSALGILSMTQM